MKTLRYIFQLSVERKNATSKGQLIQRYKHCQHHHFRNSSTTTEMTRQAIPRSYSSTTTPKGTSNEKSTTKAATVEMVERMRHRFRQDKEIHQEKTWESLWNDGMTPWDLGRPTPALVSELASHWTRNDDCDDGKIAHDCNNTTTYRRQVLRTLVPGCGAGYDLITLARHHDDLVAAGKVKHASVVGLDLSETSLHKAAEQIENALEFCPFDRPTRIDLIKGDYFECNKKWKVLYSFGGGFGGGGGKSTNDEKDERQVDCVSSSLNQSEEYSFDFIFDYTFFCALPPQRRKEWGERTSQLLVPGTGRLLTFIFPILKQDGAAYADESDSNLPTKGPPFPVTVSDYRRVLEPMGVEMESDNAYENSDTVPQRAGTELVCWWTTRGPDAERRSMAKM
jgi:methyl halide transferase